VITMSKQKSRKKQLQTKFLYHCSILIAKKIEYEIQSFEFGKDFPIAETKENQEIVYFLKTTNEEISVSEKFAKCYQKGFLISENITILELEDSDGIYDLVDKSGW